MMLGLLFNTQMMPYFVASNMINTNAKYLSEINSIKQKQNYYKEFIICEAQKQKKSGAICRTEE